MLCSVYWANVCLIFWDAIFSIVLFYCHLVLISFVLEINKLKNKRKVGRTKTHERRKEWVYLFVFNCQVVLREIFSGDFCWNLTDFFRELITKTEMFGIKEEGNVLNRDQLIVYYGRWNLSSLGNSPIVIIYVLDSNLYVEWRMQKRSEEIRNLSMW